MPNETSAHAPLAKSLSHDCAARKSWILVWGVGHEEVKHLYVSNCLSFVEELHKTWRLLRRGSGACEQQLDFENPAGDIFLLVLHVQIVSLLRGVGENTR